MRISDWSSDVCSSDLIPLADRVLAVIVTAPRQRQIGDRLVGGLGIREWQAADPRLAARCFNDIAVRIEFLLALVLQRSFAEAHRIVQGRVGPGGYALAFAPHLLYLLVGCR